MFIVCNGLKKFEFRYRLYCLYAILGSVNADQHAQTISHPKNDVHIQR